MSEGNTPSPPVRTPFKPISENDSNKSRRFGGYRPSRRDQNLAKMEVIDKNFKGADEEFGIVIGLSSELPHLTNGKVCGEFQEAVMIYIQSKFTRGGDLRNLVLKLTEPKSRIESKKPPYNVVKGSNEEVQQLKVWEAEWKRYSLRIELLENNIEKLFGLLMGQCTQALVAEIKASPEYTMNSDNSDALWLLKKIKVLSAGVDDQVNKFLTYHEKIMELSRIGQGAVETLDEYRTRFAATVLTLDMTGGEGVFHPYIKPNSNPMDITKTKERTMAMWFLMHADKVRFGAFLARLKESDIVGKDQYPETLPAAYNALLRIERELNRSRNRRTTNEKGIQLSQVRFDKQSDKENTLTAGESVVPGKNMKCYNIRCRSCNKFGHYASECPTVPYDAKTQGTMIAYTFKQSPDIELTSSIRLLDTGASHSSTNDHGTCMNIRRCRSDEVLIAKTNGGIATFDQVGKCKMLPVKMYYNPDTVATIFAFHELAALPGVSIRYDSEKENSFFLIFRSSGRVVKFKKCGQGLYFYDADKKDDHEYNINDPKISYMFLTQVSNTAALMTNQEIENADRALVYQELLGWPSTTEFKKMVSNNLLMNCDITVDDIQRSVDLYGVPVPICKGKMIRKSPSQHETMAKLPLPPKLHDSRVDLYVDLFFVGGQVFLLTKSGRINYYSIHALKSKSLTYIKEAILRDLNLYDRRGIIIITIHGDNEFNADSLKNAIQPATLEIYVRNEHVGPAERGIRTIKERT